MFNPAWLHIHIALVYIRDHEVLKAIVLFSRGQDSFYCHPQVPRLGMSTPFRGRTLQDVTKQVVSIAKGGLERRGLDEASV